MPSHTAMPTAPKRPCVVPGCPERQPCPQHVQRVRSRDERATAARRGYSSPWQRLAASMLAANPVCAWCFADAELVDHIVARRDGGTDHPSNLQPLCRACHARKTAQETAARRRRGE